MPLQLAVYAAWAVAALLFSSAVVIAACWLVEQFAESAATIARAKNIREFAIKVFKTTLSYGQKVIQMFAFTEGQILADQTRDESEYPPDYRNQLDNNGGEVYHRYGVS